MNNHFSKLELIQNKKLLEVIASEEHRFWKFISNKVYLNQATINLDKRLLENYYRNLGYHKVKVLNSFAEMNEDFKHSISHRWIAFKKLIKLSFPSLSL